MADSALILAAGASTRLGYPKALAQVGDEPALQRVIRLLQEAGVGRIVVVLGAHADAIRATSDLAGVHVFVNEEWERGRTSTLKVGFLALRAQGALSHANGADRVIIAPVDRPLFHAEDVARLLDSKAAIALPEHDGRRGHPIMVTAAVADEVLALADEEPLRTVIQRDAARVAAVPVDHPGILFNLDTPEAAAEAAATHERSRANGEGR